MTVTTPSQPVDTGKVSGRRTPRFANLDEVLADVAKLVAADREGRLVRVGNWTLGQALGHLAAWIGYGFDGPPTRPPWFVKLILRTRKSRYINHALPAGVHIPRVEGGTFATVRMTTDEGVEKYRQAIERLRAGCPEKPSVIFGRLTHEEWIRLNCRHAELHLSFFRCG
jgi:hypothetical protein